MLLIQKQYTQRGYNLIMKAKISNLLKGRATEAVFEEMFGNKERYRVLHFGFEYISSELTQVIRDKTDETFKMISKTPDFLLHDTQEKKLYLVEAKYRTKILKTDILKIAQTLSERHWGLAKLFIASPEGFFFDDVHNIISNDGKCKRLSSDEISESSQVKYLDELKKLFT